MPSNATGEISRIDTKNKRLVIRRLTTHTGLFQTNELILGGSSGTSKTCTLAKVTAGEGGMVVTNNETLYRRASHLKGQGLAAHRQYWHDSVGYNYRMTNIACAIGQAQLERSDELIAKKRKIADYYHSAFEGTHIGTIESNLIPFTVTG